MACVEPTHSDARTRAGATDVQIREMIFCNTELKRGFCNRKREIEQEPLKTKH